MTVDLVNHAHIFPEHVRPEGSIASLLRLMDACGIERAVTFAPFYKQVCATIDDPNRWAIEATRPEV